MPTHIPPCTLHIYCTSQIGNKLLEIYSTLSQVAPTSPPVNITLTVGQLQTTLATVILMSRNITVVA